MEKSRLIVALKSLQPKDLKQFNAFVRSPFFNKNQQLILLCDYLVQWHRKQSGALDKEDLHRIILPDAPFHDQKVRLAMSGLLKLLEQFIVHQNLAQNEALQRIKLAECYRKLNLNKHFPKSPAGRATSARKTILPQC